MCEWPAHLKNGKQLRSNLQFGSGTNYPPEFADRYTQTNFFMNRETPKIIISDENLAEVGTENHYLRFRFHISNTTVFLHQFKVLYLETRASRQLLQEIKQICVSQIGLGKLKMHQKGFQSFPKNYSNSLIISVKCPPRMGFLVIHGYLIKYLGRYSHLQDRGVLSMIA